MVIQINLGPSGGLDLVKASWGKVPPLGFDMCQNGPLRGGGRSIIVKINSSPPRSKFDADSKS